MSTPSRTAPRFANAAEAAFARILDYYGIRWEYEPHSFVLAWDAQGRPTERFTPDFYLPDLDLYIELTTLKQRLVARKKRKLRRLRTLYPHVRIQLWYARDVHALLRKYGLAS